MRIIRLLFLVLVAFLLVSISLANLEPLTLQLLPASLVSLFGDTYSFTLPTFIWVFGIFAIGIAAGLVWEYIREAGERRESAARQKRIKQLELEVHELRKKHANPRDEVHGILDAPKERKAS